MPTTCTTSDQHYVVQERRGRHRRRVHRPPDERAAAGREGLHQAVEAKEGVHIQAENQTLASITFQNYFRMYGKLAGMTGTADTEAYRVPGDLRPGNRGDPAQPPELARKDQLDRVYKTTQGKVRRGHRTTSGNATSAASPCWWAPPRSRTPRSSPSC